MKIHDKSSVLMCAQKYKAKQLSSRNSDDVSKALKFPNLFIVLIISCNFWGIFFHDTIICIDKPIMFYPRYLGDHYSNRKLFTEKNTTHLLACCVSTYLLRQQICHQSSSFLERSIEDRRWQNANFLGCCFS